MMVEADNPFWDFSLAVYAREGVPAACLRLQDRQGVDVNMLLFCCWTAQSAAVRLEKDALAAIADRIAPWKAEIVEPLRAARRDLKPGFDGFSPAGCDALREKIKALELEAEKLQQDALFLAFQKMAETGDRMATTGERLEIARTNVDMYLSAYATRIDDAAREDMAYVIDRAFDAA